MALVKLSDTCVINDYQQISQLSIVGLPTERRLFALTHHAWPGLTWNIKLYPLGNSKAKPNYASAYVFANFGPAKDSIASVWAEWTMTVVTGDAKAILRKSTLCREYLLDGQDTWGFVDAFLQSALTSALNNGKLELKLDLTLFKIVDLLKCRESVRALLSANQHVADVTFNVEGKPFKVHKGIIANRCPGLDPASIPLDTTADAFKAFLGAIYFDKFDLYSNWQTALGVYKLSDKLDVGFLKQFCDDALAGSIPSLGYPALLQILPEAIRCNVLLTKAACIDSLRETEGVLTSTQWKDFMASSGTDIMGPIVNGLLAAKCSKCDPVSTIFHAAEVKPSHTWAISSADIVKAIVPRPTFVPSPVFLEHKAFPAVKWQVEFYPRGNAKDPDHKKGFASLYLKAIFGPKNADLKAVYASWKATISTKDGPEICVLATSDYILYTGAKEMTFGFANAFLSEQHISAPEANDSGLEIHLELTIASIPEILKCRGLITSLRSDTEYSDIEIDVNGTVFKAHKFILAARCTVFATIFEEKVLSSGRWPVEDATPEAFKWLIAGIYYESWDFLTDMEATIGVLKLAERFGVADLKQYCDEALAHFAQKTNVFTILRVAVSHNAVAAKAACFKILFASAEFKTANEWIAFKNQNVEIAYDIVEAVGACCKHKRILVREAACAPTAKLSGSWFIDDFPRLLKRMKPGKLKKRPPLPELSHCAFPGLTWRLEFYPRGMYDHSQETRFIVKPHFGAKNRGVSSVRASSELTVLAGEAKTVLTKRVDTMEQVCSGSGTCCLLYRPERVAAYGRLEVKLDLTLVNNAELLKCRETVRGLLSPNQHADLTVTVEGKPISVHKAILAKRCKGFLEAVPDGTTHEAYSAFVGAVYWNDFEFLSKWELTLDVFILSDKFIAADLKELCDLALSDLVPTLHVSELLKVLPAAFQHGAPMTKARCVRILADKKADEKSPDFQAICDAFQKLGIVSVPSLREVVYRPPEVKVHHTWDISGPALSKAITSRQPAAVSLESFLEHKAFPGLKWQLVCYPFGNTRDREHKRGFSSLYLEAIRDTENDDDEDVEAVYAKWTAVVTFKDGKPVTIPASAEFNVSSCTSEAKFGFANAFPWQQYDNGQGSKSSNPVDTSLNIQLHLTIASIPEMLKCQRLISSLHCDKIHADVEIDVNRTVFKAHKFLLAARSSFFAGMFETAMKENATSKVEVKETTPEAFKAFLGAIYCNRWDFLYDMDATMDVLVLAERCGVADLKRYCDDALAQFASNDNVFAILAHASIHNATAAKAACVKILFASGKLLASEGWADFKALPGEIQSLDFYKPQKDLEHNPNIAFDVVEAAGDYFWTLKN